MDDLERLERFLRWRRDNVRERAARRRRWAVPVIVLVSIGIATVGLIAWLKANAPPPASSSAGARGGAAVDQPVVTQPSALARPSAVAVPPAIAGPPDTTAPSRGVERPVATATVPPAVVTAPALRSDRRAPQGIAPKTAWSPAHQPPPSETGRPDPASVSGDSPESALSPVKSPSPTPPTLPAPQVEPTGPAPVESPGPPTAMTAERGDAAEIEAAAVAPALPVPRLVTESPSPEPDVSTAVPPAEMVADPGRPAPASSEPSADTTVTPPPRVSDRVGRWAKGEIQEFRHGMKREIEHFRSGLAKVRRGIDGLRSRLRGTD